MKIELKPGINIIKAPNASGKTSLIRGFTSMFSNRIPSSHILALDKVTGKIRLKYAGKIYQRRFRRTPSGSVLASGKLLPFADNRAFDACVALAETGVVHKITGGEKLFREYLENLSFGRYYSTIISGAQKLINNMSRELLGSSFRKFDELPLLLTEITTLQLKREAVKDEINSLQFGRLSGVKNLKDRIDEINPKILMEEANLSGLLRESKSEEEKTRQLTGFLKLTDENSEIASQIKKSISESISKKDIIQFEISKLKKHILKFNKEEKQIKSIIKDKKLEELKKIENLKKKVNLLDKEVILKEEEIQQAECFPIDNQKYPGKLVVEVRSYIANKIEWLEKITEYFQEKYMHRMTSARIRFNNNINKAFNELELEGFNNLFLDQDFKLHVVRDNNIQQPLETLSASEKLTVSIILMLAAKETFLPDFPFFIIDELTLSYDPARLKKIIHYLEKRMPYTILTSLTEKGRGKPQVFHKI
jgi:hypothetical protein